MTDRLAVSAWPVIYSACGGSMTDIRRARASRQNLPRLQGARELMPAVCPACSRPRLREPSCGCLPRCGKVLKTPPLGKLPSG